MVRSDIYLETWLAVLTEAGSRCLNICSSRSGFFIISVIVHCLQCHWKFKLFHHVMNLCEFVLIFWDYHRKAVVRPGKSVVFLTAENWSERIHRHSDSLSLNDELLNPSIQVWISKISVQGRETNEIRFVCCYVASQYQLKCWHLFQ